MFAMYALTYTLPSLGSFMVEGYHNTTVADHDPSAPRPNPRPKPPGYLMPFGLLDTRIQTPAESLFFHREWS